MLLDLNGVVLEANAAFQRMFGYTREELVGRIPLSLIVPESAVDASLEAFRRNTEQNEPARLSAVRKRKDGELISAEVLAYPVMVNGQPRGVFAIYQDVTEKERALREIEYQVRHDRLTGLANGAAQVEVMKQLLDGRDDKTQHAFLYLNINQFKVINDSCGHSEGDRALTEIAHLLQSCVRGTYIGRPLCQ